MARQPLYDYKTDHSGNARRQDRLKRDESDPRQNVCHCARARAGHDASGIAQDRIRSRSTIRPQVVQLLKDGCAHMRKAFDIEDLNLDALIDTAMEDPQGHRRRNQGVPRHQLRRPRHRLQAVLRQRTGRHRAVRSEAGDRVLQRRRREPARPQQAEEPQAARHQRRARRQGRQVRRAVRIRSAPRLGAAIADAGIRAAGVCRRRGQAVLSAQGHRRARPDPRLHHQHRRARPAAGRLDHHPAGRQEPPGRRRRQLRAQDPRDDRGLAHRPVAEQGRNPRDLSQLDLSRPRRLGHRHGRPQLLQEAGVGADA